MTIPYTELHISPSLEDQLKKDPDVRIRIALATGAACSSDTERLGLCVLLSNDEDARVVATAKRTLKSWESSRIQKALKRDTHGKVLEYIIEFLVSDSRLDQAVFRCFNLNERTAYLIASRADEQTCDEISKCRQQLLLYPQIYWELAKNSRCPEKTLARIKTFLQMQNTFLDEPKQSVGSSQNVIEMTDLEAEIEAALMGKQSPSLLKAQESLTLFDLDEGKDDSVGTFSFDFRSENEVEFSFDLTGEQKSSSVEEEEEFVSLEQRIKNMPVGHKIKLAFKGNKEARSILIRDTNKSVAVAVVKSGRLTDGEVSSYAGNRNLADDVIREISSNKEFVRKYPVKVALVNNPKTPTSTALSFVSMLHKKDLQHLSRNKNVSSVISTAALKRFKEKFRRS